MRYRFIFALTLLLSGIAQAQEADFRLMSFNMERGDLGISKGWGWDVRKPAALDMLAAWNPSLLGVQECNSGQRDDILGRMTDYGYIGLSVAGEQGEHTTSANYIFYDRTCFELLDHGAFWYAFDPAQPGMYTWFARKPRSATWGRFRHIASGRELIYVNNHLQNGVDAVTNRAMSINLLLGKMREINPDGLPMIYTGDLNSKCIEGYYAPLNQEMKEAALTCPETDLGTTLGSYKTKTGGSRIDHIFYSGAIEGLRYAVDRENYAGLEYVSDHFPVYTDLRFTDGAQARQEGLWYDLQPEEGDVSVKAGTWNLFSTVERDARKAPSWSSVKETVAQVVPTLGADILAFQELTDPMARDLPKLLRKTCGKSYKLWVQFSDENPENSAREAVALLYNADRFSLSRQRVSWITAGAYEVQSKAWGSGPWALLSAVVTEKASGKKFFVMTGRLAKGENPVKYEGNVIKKIEKELNPEQLPCLLLVDMNVPPKGQVWLSLLNYWTDTFALMHPFPDTQFSTRIPADGFYAGNTSKDWGTKFDIVAVSRYVENRIIVTEHTVHREIATLRPVPSDHCPVTATVVFKR